ncbi:acetyl-CoA C-acyltransferase [Ammonicoccus fulvus]|uniref:Probable acetyl-CoA acetyltransferase n=1 Tax=Ammonicoccus fulvus TaxID=3138240 RepID=A0ABZ3FR94_9ACTN
MGAVIVGGARTPIGRFRGALGRLSGHELGAHAIRGALAKVGLPPERVDYVVMGQVLQAGEGQMPARRAAIAAGIPTQVPALGINKVCLSGLAAIALADQLIRAGEVDVVVAGGMESMSNAPHLLPGSRAGFGYGDAVLLDHLEHDGLRDAHTGRSMGALTEADNEGVWHVARAEQDAYAARSHHRAHAAAEFLADEIVPLTLTGRAGETVIAADEGVRPDTSIETLARLTPAFTQDGTITAGSSSPLSDGAAALVIASAEAAAELGLPVLAEIVAHGMVAGPGTSLQGKPSGAVRVAAAKAGLAPDGFDRYETNEAFAQVVLGSARDLGLSEDAIANRVNVNGGAIALGHPIGMSGARIVLTLARELERSGGGTGVAALCGGGGQGEALIVRVPEGTREGTQG